MICSIALTVFLVSGAWAADLEAKPEPVDTSDKVPVEDPAFLKLDQSQMPLQVRLGHDFFLTQGLVGLWRTLP